MLALTVGSFRRGTAAYRLCPQPHRPAGHAARDCPQPGPTLTSSAAAVRHVDASACRLAQNDGGLGATLGPGPGGGARRCCCWSAPWGMRRGRILAVWITIVVQLAVAGHRRHVPYAVRPDPEPPAAAAHGGAGLRLYASCSPWRLRRWSLRGAVPVNRRPFLRGHQPDGGPATWAAGFGGTWLLLAGRTPWPGSPRRPDPPAAARWACWPSWPASTCRCRCRGPWPQRSRAATPWRSSSSTQWSGLLAGGAGWGAWLVFLVGGTAGCRRPGHTRTGPGR